MKKPDEQGILTQESGHSGCRIESMPEALSGNHGVQVSCRDCGATIEKPFDGHDVGSNPSYEDPTVRAVVERMAGVPCVRTHKNRLRPIRGQLTGKICCVQVLCDECGASVIRALGIDDWWAVYDSRAVREALLRILEMPCLRTDQR